MFPLVTSRVAASDTRPRRSFRLSPAQTIVAGFGLADLVGTGLLMLPAATRDGEGASFVHALFTSTSAVCVTGLVVVDTETYWTPLGHLVILALIQIGGIGIMVFASLVGVLLARRLSVRSRVLAATEAKALSLDDVRGVVRRIVVTSLLIEAALFLVLFPSFALRYGHGWGEGAWYALFHSVSAFNNAGFALYADSLVRFAADPWVCLPICAAVILGGLGFPVLMQLRREIGRPLLWSMNTRLVLFGSVILLVGGTVYITALEWTNPATLGAYDPAARVLIGFFHSVQTRTAGFNSIDVGAMHDETWLGMDVLMFIGGGPAGTAGGIKITTFAVLLFILVAELRGAGAVNIFGKRLSRAVHRQAIAVVLIAVGVVVASTIALMIVTGGSLDRMLFESVSAFATVGLSTGVTADLPEAAEIILSLLMFVGRLGPLTIGTALALRERRVSYEFPKERPAIG